MTCRKTPFYCQYTHLSIKYCVASLLSLLAIDDGGEQKKTGDDLQV